MEKQIIINYWWECAKIKGEIPESLICTLKDSAFGRISETMKEGYTSGELCENIFDDIPNRKTPKDGWEFHGFWTATECDAVEVIGKPVAITKPYTKKEARKLVKHNALKAIVALDFDEIMTGIECLNDAVSTMICGNECSLEDISYEPVGVDKDGNVLVEVCGSIENWLEEKD
jgi:hypothetical protein